MKCCQPGKLIRDSAPKVFIRCWSHRHSVPDMYPNFRLPKGRQTFSISHIVDKLPCSELLIVRAVGTLLKSKLPDSNQAPATEAGLLKDRNWACHVNSFLHTCI